MIDHYRKALLKQAERRTKRMLRKAGPRETLTLEIWGEELQNAYLKAGWHPVSESPRVDLTDHTSWTEMTMTITKGA